MRLGWAAVVCLLVACSRPTGAPGFVERKAWQPAEPLGGLDLARDGQAVVLGSSTGESSLWTAPWKLSVPFDRLEGTLIGASFTSEGYVLSMRAEGLVELRSSSGAAIQELQLPLPGPAERATASEAGQFVAFDGRLYALDGSKLVLEGANHVALAGDRFAVAARGDAVEARALEGAEVREFRAPGAVSATAISRDGGRVAAASGDRVVVWQGDDLTPACERDVGGAVLALRFSRSARWLVVASGETLRVLDVATCRERSVLQLSAAAVALDLDGDLAAVGDARGSVYAWDSFNQRLLARGQVLSGAVRWLRVHAGTRSVLAGQGAEAKLLGVP